MNETNAPHGPAEWAALYAAGALPPHEAAAFGARLAAGDEECREELARLDAVVSGLYRAAPGEAPPPSARAALLARVTAAAQEIVIERDERRLWQEIGIPGVLMRLLSRDPERNLETYLLRMSAGSALPRHLHLGPEECYIVEGEVQTWDTVLRAGDFVRAPAGSRHGVTRTEGGCVLLLTTAIDGVAPDPDDTAP